MIFRTRFGSLRCRHRLVGIDSSGSFLAEDFCTIRGCSSVVSSPSSHDEVVEMVGSPELICAKPEELRVAVIAYGVSPVRGTEPGNSWRFAIGLAERGVKVELFTTELFRDEWALASTPSNLRICPVSGVLPSVLPGRLGLYWSYLKFLESTTGLLRSLSKESPFDVVHDYSWGSLAWGTPVWKAGIPTVFGPVGGGTVSPRNLYPLLSPSSKIIESLRTLVIRGTFLNRRVINSIRHTTVVAANSNSREVIVDPGARHPVGVIPESATPEDFLNRPVTPLESRQSKTIVWMGGLLPRKGITLALKVLSQMPQEFNMLVLGDGPKMASARKQAVKLGVENRVSFLGHVSWSEVQNALDVGIAFLFTSIRDTFGAQVLEAAARGTPIVAMRHQGIADFVPTDAGVLVEPGHIDTVIEDMAAGILELSCDQEKWQRSSVAARTFAEDRRLEALLDHFQSVYESLSSIDRMCSGFEQNA